MFQPLKQSVKHMGSKFKAVPGEVIDGLFGKVFTKVHKSMFCYCFSFLISLSSRSRHSEKWCCDCGVILRRFLSSSDVAVN